jgi:type I restriction enzyme, S subunit
MSDLPEGWVHELLSTLAQWGSGGTPSRNNLAYYGGNIPWIKTGELGQGIITDTEEKITELGLQNSSAKIFPKGSVAVAMYGATIGKTAILDIDAATNQACAVGIPVEGLTTKEYLFYYLTSQKDAFAKAGQGGAQPNISQTVIKNWSVPLAPLNEQKRIADKLDRLLAKVDACRERCDRIPLLLKRFRQSVLAAATSGELTEDWHISSINAEHQWQNVSLDEICLSITDGDHQAPPIAKKGIPFITISAINTGKLQIEKATRFVPDSYFEGLKHIRKPIIGDVLFSVTGSIAIPALVDSHDKFTFQRHIAILKPDHSKILSRFLFYSLGTEDIKQQALAVATGTAQLTIPLSGLRKFRANLPSIHEQQEIIHRVEKLFAFADRLEARYQKARAKCDQLTPALLEKAFQGELIPQDPNDEPASVLLERIKSLRSSEEAYPTKSQRRKTASEKSKSYSFEVKMLKRKDIQASHLSDILKASGSLTAEALWTASQLEIDDFYDQLKDEETQNLLKETKVENSDTIRLLEAA